MLEKFSKEAGMRVISTEEITKNIKEMCIEANYELSLDVKRKIYEKADTESDPLGKQILIQLRNRKHSDLSGYWYGCCIYQNRTKCKNRR